MPLTCKLRVIFLRRFSVHIHDSGEIIYGFCGIYFTLAELMSAVMSSANGNPLSAFTELLDIEIGIVLELLQILKTVRRD